MPTPFNNLGMPNAPSQGLKPFVQRGVASFNATSFTVTISAVNPARSELRLLGFNYGGTAISEFFPRVDLTNATTLTFSKFNSSFTTTVSWELTEWK